MASRRIKLTIAYDGTDFCGWQVQPDLPTIQGLLEQAFFEIEKKPVHVAGSGRTDAGVHALAQVAAVTLENPIPLANLRKALNRQLPTTIRVNGIEEVHSAFHPRFDAIAKTYEYRIARCETCSPFVRRYVHHHPYPLSESRFIAAASFLEGEHDFTAFAASDDRDQEGGSKVRTVFSSTAVRNGDLLVYRVTGSGFLKHMVRNIVGTLIEVAKGNLSEDGLRGLLSNPDRKAGPRAPASGLFLIEVLYPDVGESSAPVEGDLTQHNPA